MHCFKAGKLNIIMPLHLHIHAMEHYCISVMFSSY